MQTVGITISGKVQGVFFRNYTIEAAQKAGVEGFVMNTPDGNVYIEACGTASAIADLIEWCHKGSPWSRVDKVAVDQLPSRQFEGFIIRYH